MRIRSVTVSECYTNCYICMNKDTKEGFIVDPGDDELKISVNVSRLEMIPKAILLTHGHFDHIGAVNQLKERYNIPVIVGAKEEKILTDSRMNLSSMFGEPVKVNGDKFLEDGENFQVAGFDIQYVLTPGHTPGSGCFYIEEEQVLFSGDTLFQASRGRTDFPGGSESDIIKSIKNKLLVLPGETEVYPGHMNITNIDSEKVYY
ncbi:MAG: MBL fold metallo-hydrolase [Eubacterium sp.]